jgi:ADP-heptose:LPS heptosyltransferase
LTITPFFHNELWKESAIPAFFLGAHAVFVFGQAGGRVLSERLSEKMDCPVYWIRSFPPPERLQPVSSYIAEQFREKGWYLKPVTPHIDPLPKETAAAEEWLAERGLDRRRPVFLHAGSGGKKKIWPLARWWTLIRWLRRTCNLPVILASGPADACLEGFTQEAIKRLGVHTVEALSLTRLAALLAKSSMYIGNDSGVSHLAASLGTPTVAIFGPTLPEVWAPRGLHVQVIKSRWDETEIFQWNPEPQAASVEPAVLDVIERLLHQ